MDNTKKYRRLGDTPHLHVGKLIGKILNLKGITQAEAAKRLGITAPVLAEYLNKQFPAAGYFVENQHRLRLQSAGRHNR